MRFSFMDSVLYLHTRLNFITMYGHLVCLVIVHDYITKMAIYHHALSTLFPMNTLKCFHRKLNEFDCECECLNKQGKRGATMVWWTLFSTCYIFYLKIKQRSQRARVRLWYKLQVLALKILRYPHIHISI